MPEMTGFACLSHKRQKKKDIASNWWKLLVILHSVTIVTVFCQRVKYW